MLIVYATSCQLNNSDKNKFVSCLDLLEKKDKIYYKGKLFSGTTVLYAKYTGLEVVKFNNGIKHINASEPPENVPEKNSLINDALRKYIDEKNIIDNYCFNFLIKHGKHSDVPILLNELKKLEASDNKILSSKKMTDSRVLCLKALRKITGKNFGSKYSDWELGLNPSTNPKP